MKIRSKTQNYLNLYAVEGLRTLCIAKRVRGRGSVGGAGPAAGLSLHSSGGLSQVLSKEEYACWLQSHLEAESSLDNREELLFQSAIRLETNLHLLGNYAQSGYLMPWCGVCESWTLRCPGCSQRQL